MNATPMIARCAARQPSRDWRHYPETRWQGRVMVADVAIVMRNGRLALPILSLYADVPHLPPEPQQGDA